MDKLKAAIQALEHLHKHVLQHMHKEFIQATTAQGAETSSGQTIEFDRLDYTRQFYKEVYLIHLDLLDTLKIMYRFLESHKDIRSTYEQIQEEMDTYLSPFWHHLDRRKVLGDVDHKSHFHKTYKDIEAGIDDILEKEMSEEGLLEKVNELLARTQSVLDRTARRFIESEHSYYRADRHERIRIWKRLLNDIRNGLEKEKKLMDAIREGNEKAQKDLEKLREQHHKFLHDFEYEHFFEIPSKKDLLHNPDMLLKIARHAGIDLKKYATNGTYDYEAITKNITDAHIKEYLAEEDTLREFGKFYEQERTRLLQARKSLSS